MKRAKRLDQARLYRGDCREILPQLDEPIAAVITDPPYSRKFVPLYGELAEHAARLLKPGGSFLALCGQTHVAEVIALTSEHLRFWWLCGMYHNKGSYFPIKSLMIRWKPAVWLVQHTRHDKRAPNDMQFANRDKEHHEWQQPVEWFEHWISNVTQEGDVVLDPCMGSGTTGVACARLGRRFIGIEIEKAAFETARERIEAAGRQGDLFRQQPSSCENQQLTFV